MTRRKRIGLTDTVRSALDTPPNDGATQAVEIVPVEVVSASGDGAVLAVTTDVIEATSTAVAEFRDRAPSAIEIEPTDVTAATADGSPPVVPAPDDAGVVATTAAADVPPSIAKAPPAVLVTRRSSSNAATVAPAPRRIGIFCALGGLAGAVGLPALIGYGVASLVGGIALGTLAGLIVASPRDRGERRPSPRSSRSKA